MEPRKMCTFFTPSKSNAFDGFIEQPFSSPREKDHAALLFLWSIRYKIELLAK